MRMLAMGSPSGCWRAGSARDRSRVVRDRLAAAARWAVVGAVFVVGLGPRLSSSSVSSSGIGPVVDAVLGKVGFACVSRSPDAKPASGDAAPASPLTPCAGAAAAPWAACGNVPSAEPTRRHHACGLGGHRAPPAQPAARRRILTLGCGEQVAAAERPGEPGVVFVGQGAGVHDVLNLGDLASQEHQEMTFACRRIERGDRVVDGLDQLTLNVLQPAAAGHGHRMRSQDRLGELYFRRAHFGVVATQLGLQGAHRIGGVAGLRGVDRRMRHSSPPPRLSWRSGRGANSVGNVGRPAPSNSSWACDSAVSTVLTCPSSHPSTSAPSVASQPNPQYGGLSAAISTVVE